jgi:hypothetical protein
MTKLTCCSLLLIFSCDAVAWCGNCLSLFCWLLMILYITIFTLMQDNSTLGWPPYVEHICKGKIFYYEFNMFNTESMSASIHLYQSVSPSPSSQYLHFPDSPIITILFTATPQHIIRHNHCIGYIALFVTHHNDLWWDALPFLCGLHWLSNTFIFPAL